MQFGQEKFREIGLFDLTSFFGLDFLKFSGSMWVFQSKDTNIFFKKLNTMVIIILINKTNC